MDLRAPGIYVTALRRAAILLGGESALRARLHVPMARLRAWLEGAEQPPPHVFLFAVDILSSAPAPAPAVHLDDPLPAARSRKLHDALRCVLSATGAQRGNIQLARADGLYIEAQIGFQAPFLDFFARVADQSSACGAAASGGRRVVVPHVEQDPIFAGTAACSVMLEAGALAVQSTPLVSGSGELLGMLSTHYEQPCRPSDDELRIIDRVASDIAFWLASGQARA